MKKTATVSPEIVFLSSQNKYKTEIKHHCVHMYGHKKHFAPPKLTYGKPQCVTPFFGESKFRTIICN